MKKELENVTVGDKVLAYGSYGYSVECVTGVSKKTIITNAGRYDRYEGYSTRVGNECYIKVATKLDLAKLRLRNRLDELCLQVEYMDEEIVTKLLERLNLNNKEYE